MSLTAKEYFDQAEMGAHDWLVRAVRSIDEVYDEPGYAKKNPQLVGAYLQTCAIDFLASHGVAQLSASIDTVAQMLDE